MFPDANQLYATFAAIGHEALVAASALALPSGQLFVAGDAPVPVTSMHLNKYIADTEVDEVEPDRNLSFKYETVLIKEFRDPILKPARLVVQPDAMGCESCEHFRRRLVLRIPGVITRSVAENAIVVIYP
jgi:hypothetical protein